MLILRAPTNRPIVIIFNREIIKRKWKSRVAKYWRIELRTHVLSFLSLSQSIVYKALQYKHEITLPVVYSVFTCFKSKLVWL
jgi:hypothetical protein